MQARFLLAVVVALACNLAHADTLTIDETMAARRALDSVQTLEAHTAQQPDVRAWLLDQISTARASLETAQRGDVRQRLIDVASRAKTAGMLLNNPALTTAAGVLEQLAERLD